MVGRIKEGSLSYFSFRMRKNKELSLRKEKPRFWIMWVLFNRIQLKASFLKENLYSQTNN